jgi:plastocyanin
MVVNATGNASFVPAEITIDPGTRVRWLFVGGTPHTVTPRDAGQNGVWARQVIDESNLSFEHVFNVAGQTYDYFCEPHEVAGMTGKVTVR